MNEAALAERLSGLGRLAASSSSPVSETAITPFGKALSTLRGEEPFRISPPAFAERFGLDPEATLDLFVFGSKTGLFDFEWNLLCPYCGGREHSHGSLNQLERESYHCTLCDADLEVAADDLLEVTFALKRDVAGDPPDPHASRENYYARYFSPAFTPPPEYAAALARILQPKFFSLPPRSRARLRLSGAKAGSYRIVTFDSHAIAYVRFPPEAASESASASMSFSGAFSPQTVEAAGGRVELELRNDAPSPAGFIVIAPDPDRFGPWARKYPPVFGPFLSGRRLLNHQIFRELFLVDGLPDDLSLRVRDLTLMFTDLKGSTDMYDRMGDDRAYALVQGHFRILQDIVAKNRGAVVKTMGDAIMASFSTPIDGFAAGSEMIGEIGNFNASGKAAGEGLGLKIGLHRGGVIAVKANQTLDYFGQTVNVAARVQALAGPGEIWATDDVMRDAAKCASSAGFETERSEVALKGVGGKVGVFRSFRRG